VYVSRSVSKIEVASTLCSVKAYQVPHGNRYSIERIVLIQKKTRPRSLIDSPPEWDGLSPDVVLKCCKTVPTEVLRASGVHDFYKSYPSWVKMSKEQKNKSLAWFRSLPEETQGIISFYLLLSFRILTLTFF
jgi:hypothetical protein